MKIVVTVVMLLVWSSAGGVPETTSTASEWWNRGIAAARNDKPDSALVCMKKAFSQGLSDDSLYYLWAEVYLYKGVLDTALALNYSVFTDTTSALRRQVVKQRYMIYTSLGWKKEAGELLDTLKGNLPWYQKIIPECNLYLSGGGYLENNTVDKEYPYPRSSDSTATLSNGSGIASLRLGWRLPFGKTHGIRFGGKMRVTGSRFAVVQSTSHLSDSAETSFGGYLNYSLLSDQLSLNYTFSRKRDFLDVRSFYHQVALRYAVIGKRWFGTVEAGYNYENPVKEHYYYLMTWWNRMVGKRHDLSGMLFLSGMTAEPLVIPDAQLVNVKNGIAWDANYSRPLFLGIEILTQGTKINTVIPQSYWAIHPSAMYEFSISKKISLGGGLNYIGNWYRDENKWIDYRYSDNTQIPQIPGLRFDGLPYLVSYNSDDDRYYWVDSIGAGREGIPVFLDTVSLKVYSRRRIDQAISLNLFIKTSIGILGDVQFDISFRRNFSNLVNEAPIDIERWYSAATLTWFFRYRPEIYR